MNTLIEIGPLGTPKPPRPKNLKAGDKVKFVGAGPHCTEGVIRDINGAYVYIVCRDPRDNEPFEIERYDTEITERLAEFCPIPVTQDRLKRLLELAQEETEERKRRRITAQEELMELLHEGQIFRTSDGVWAITPERHR